MSPLVDTFLESQPESGYPTDTPDMLSHALIPNEIPMGVFESSEDANTSYPSSTHLESHMLEGCDQTRTRLGSPVDDDIMKSWEYMGIFCSDVQPWHLHDPESRLHFVTDRVKAFPGQIADCNAAPFLHQNLYQDSMPRCILSCFSTCVLYTKRTPANTGMVLRTLQNNVRDLVDGESHQNTPLHRLARTQALFIYQIIRLFDGDISLRAQGEKHMHLLQAWLDELCCLRNNLGNTANGEESQASPTWKEWIFDESVRRTIIIAYSVIGLYDMMKEPGEKLGSHLPTIPSGQMTEPICMQDIQGLGLTFTAGRSEALYGELSRRQNLIASGGETSIL
ncbi:hypothetical protein NM208_g4655 [Fusarium decemcellulare]|uniref:Uncharacterized protein n=1 Tax=Fusarium decemcellulare TaxID=57161 RepID=A0ACC1SK08_9HYPO|nr:hypothetical protein NM208_g4655 [Fusarium decemcellulare]